MEKELKRTKKPSSKIPVGEYPAPAETMRKGFTSFVAFDVETTGIDPNRDSLTEIGAIKVINGKIVEEERFIFQELIHPYKKRIPGEVEEITGITNAMVKNAREMWDVFPDFMEFVGKNILLGYNCMRFDSKFLARAGRYSNLIIENKYFDVMKMADKYKKQLGFKDLKLETVSKKLGISNPDAHRALSDAITTARVYMELMQLSKPAVTPKSVKPAAASKPVPAEEVKEPVVIPEETAVPEPEVSAASDVLSDEAMLIAEAEPVYNSAKKEYDAANEVFERYKEEYFKNMDIYNSLSAEYETEQNNYNGNIRKFNDDCRIEISAIDRELENLLYQQDNYSEMIKNCEEELDDTFAFSFGRKKHLNEELESIRAEIKKIKDKQADLISQKEYSINKCNSMQQALYNRIQQLAAGIEKCVNDINIIVEKVNAAQLEAEKCETRLKAVENKYGKELIEKLILMSSNGKALE